MVLLKDLPDELLVDICQRLDIEDLSRISKSSKDLHRICSEILKDRVDVIKQLSEIKDFSSSIIFRKNGKQIKINWIGLHWKTGQPVYFIEKTMGINPNFDPHQIPGLDKEFRLDMPEKIDSNIKLEFQGDKVLISVEKVGKLDDYIYSLIRNGFKLVND